MDLSPLRAAFDDLEKAVAGVAEKISTSVESDVSQDEVNQLVDRANGYVERLAGLTPPAVAPAAAPAAEAPAAASGVPAGGTATWTPDKPSS